MARSEARLSVEIWNDRHFVTLTPMAQRLYMFLLSQADLAHTGVIGLRERRWSKSAAALTPADIERDLKELEANGYLVIDWDAEEVLIRTFIRGDKVYRQPQVLAVAAEQLTLVTSLALRVALRVELERIAQLEMVQGSRTIISAMLVSLAMTVDGEPICGNPDIPKDGQASLSISAAPEGGQHPAEEGAVQALGDWGVTDATKVFPNPHSPGTPSPQSSTPMSADALIPLASLTHLATADAATDSESTANTSTTGKTRRKRKAAPVSPATTEEFIEAWDEWPRSDKRQAAVAAHQKARISVEQADLVAAIRSYIAYERARGTEDRFIPYFSTWLNQERWKDLATRPDRPGNVVALHGDRGARPPMRSTTDERVSGWLDIAAAAREASQ